MNDKKIQMIIACRDEAERDSLMQQIGRIGVPNGYSVDCRFELGADTRAQKYNRAMRATDAKYKVYISEELLEIASSSLLCDVITVLRNNPRVAAVGLLGSELPLDGEYASATSIYGAYHFMTEDGGAHIAATNPFWYQEVATIDDRFIATAVDIEWDESLPDDYIVRAQCLRLRAAGHKIMVPMQNAPLVIYRTPSLYTETVDEAQAAIFRAKYAHLYQPLVSILIPTYNQPEFARVALESALVQTYQHSEILVSDDSTTSAVRDMVEPYARRDSRVRYIRHRAESSTGLKNSCDLLRAARGEYIQYLFHDDLLVPTKLEKMLPYYIADLNKEIGVVTSLRATIDGAGEQTGCLPTWRHEETAIVDGATVGWKILTTMQNYIGELTTVLLRRSDIIADDGTDIIGVFADYHEDSMADVSTYLELARRGRKFVFLPEILSAFRQHDGQNTYNVYVRAQSPIDWWAFLYLAYRGWMFGITRENFCEVSRRWALLAGRYGTPRNVALAKNERERAAIEMIDRLITLGEQEKFRELEQAIADYIASRK